MDAGKEPVSGPGLLLALDRESGAPLHAQLELRLREHVRSGRLAPGSRLPSSRALAAELDVSRGVVLEAYEQLTAEGYLTASQGAPTRVAATAGGERAPVPASSLTRRHALDFSPVTPDLGAFPAAGWARSLRSVAREVPFGELGHGDPRGAAAAAQRVDELPRAGARGGARARAHADLRRVHPGPGDRLPGAARPGRRADRRRGSGVAAPPPDRRARRTGAGAGGGRRARDRRRATRATASAKRWC